MSVRMISCSLSLVNIKSLREQTVFQKAKKDCLCKTLFILLLICSCTSEKKIDGQNKVFFFI